MRAQSMPLLRSKLLVPQVPEALVERPRLHGVLASAAPVTLLCAPAGWGKTVLLSSWLRTDHPAAGTAAWLTAEPGDDQQFWAYLRAALDVTEVAAPQIVPQQVFLAQLAEALLTRAAGTVIVLDDFHHVRDPNVLDGLEFLVRHASPALRLVIGTRREPDLPLHRWRLNGKVTELRCGELAFTPAETAELLHRHGLVLSADQVRDLHARTEGWPAGVRMAALAAPKPARMANTGLEVPGLGVTGLAHTCGAHGLTGAASDYVATEVLAGQPAEVRDVLARAAILDRMCAGLVDALADRRDGARILAELARHGLVVPAEEGWFRPHRMVADVLLAALPEATPNAATADAVGPGETIADRVTAEATESGEAASNVVGQDAAEQDVAGRCDGAPVRLIALHRRAADWYATHGLPAEALRHALAGEDWAQATRVADQHWPQLVEYGHVRARREDSVPAGVRHGKLSGELAVAYAADRLGELDRRYRPAMVPHHESEHSLVDTVDEIFALLDRAGDTVPAAAMRLAIAARAGERVTAEQAATALLRLAGPDPRAGAIAYGVLGLAALAHGRLADARRLLTDGVASAQRAHLRCTRRANSGRLALVHAIDGELRTAEEVAWAALDQPACPARPATVHCGAAYLALAVVALERGRLDEAKVHVDVAIDAGDPALTGWSALLLARLRHACGDLSGSFEALHALRDDAPPLLSTWAMAIEADLHIAHGDPAAARRLVQSTGDGVLATAALARAHLREGDPQAALRVVPEWAEDGSAPSHGRLVAGLVEALAAQRTGDRRRAVRVLERVLQLAEPEGFRQVFSDAGTEVRDLLAAHLETGTAYWPFVNSLVAGTRPATPNGARSAPNEVLTDRELTVLRYLQSLLSNGEIADTLCVSVNTVKTHVRNIYRKLDTTRRRDAVRRARELHLL